MNDSDPVVHEALRWLRFSEEDLDVALRLITGPPSAPRHACWLSQQAAEKALKAALWTMTRTLAESCDGANKITAKAWWPFLSSHNLRNAVSVNGPAAHIR